VETHHAAASCGHACNLRNRPFIILLISYTISAIGSNLPATLILYYVEYVLESNRANLFLFIYFAVGYCHAAGVDPAGGPLREKGCLAGLHGPQHLRFFRGLFPGSRR
jgi:Na+/melibiose symporter-like transporter